MVRQSLQQKIRELGLRAERLERCGRRVRRNADEHRTRDSRVARWRRFATCSAASSASGSATASAQNPRAVYEQAIQERTRQYRELKEAVAGILYMRNKLEAEIRERRAEIARLHDDVRRGVRRGQDDARGRADRRSKQALLEELERSERELEGVRGEAEDAKENCVRFREEIRGLVREKGRMLATLANAARAGAASRGARGPLGRRRDARARGRARAHRAHRDREQARARDRRRRRNRACALRRDPRRARHEARAASSRS